MIALPFLLLAYTSGASAISITFENGLHGYTGTQDTYISGKHEQREKNYGTAKSLLLKAGNKPENILLGFDISSLPSHLIIDSATLWLYKLSGAHDPIAKVFEITSGPWSEGDGGNATLGDVDWIHRNHPGTAWNTPGLGAGTDYETPFSDSEHLFGGKGWHNWDVSSIVKDWYSGEDPNYGFVLKAWGDTNEQKFASSESPSWCIRPKLTINYHNQHQQQHQHCAVPEPTSLTLLGLGLFGFLGNKIKERSKKI